MSTEETGETRSVIKLTDPRALRAYAHPVRMALVGLLRTEGPLTATQAGQALGESSGTTSFHLRQLAKYGLVEEAGGGTGREKPWRATTMFTEIPVVAESPELAAAASLVMSTVAERYFDQLQRWLDRSQQYPVQWQEAAQTSDRFLYLTADELADLGHRISALLDVYLERQAKPELRPDGARMVTYLNVAFPLDPRHADPDTAQ